MLRITHSKTVISFINLLVCVFVKCYFPLVIHCLCVHLFPVCLSSWRQAKHASPCTYIEITYTILFKEDEPIIANPPNGIVIYTEISEKLLELKNYNGTMEILSGLNHGAVSRLRNTWVRYN